MLQRKVDPKYEKIKAMRYSKMFFFFGAYSALVIMTGLSCALGQVVSLIPHNITHYIAASLFASFAFQIIYKGKTFLLMNSNRLTSSSAYKMRG